MKVAREHLVVVHAQVQPHEKVVVAAQKTLVEHTQEAKLLAVTVVSQVRVELANQKGSQFRLWKLGPKAKQLDFLVRIVAPQDFVRAFPGQHDANSGCTNRLGQQIERHGSRA